MYISWLIFQTQYMSLYVTAYDDKFCRYFTSTKKDTRLDNPNLMLRL